MSLYFVGGKIMLKKFSNNIYYMPPVEETDRPILAAIVGDDKVLIVDGGNSTDHAKTFLCQLDNLGIYKKRLLAITHWHWDHVFGIKEMDALTFCHKYTANKIKDMMGLDWSDEALDERVAMGEEIEFCSEKIKAEFKEDRNIELKVPEVIFEKSISIDIGNHICILEHVGGNHSPDSTFIYSTKEKTLFIGDSLFVDIYNGEWSWTVDGVRRLGEKILSYDAEYFVEAHVDEKIPREKMEETIDRYIKIGEIVEELGYNRNAILEKLERRLRHITEDDLLSVDWYIAGHFKKRVK
ncbi:hypothetical protein CCE28_01080 [Anaeromicrobium sediminis]|uniref:Metallo-beta-lactamase domain-containing protein n=2 Tax=Anaeromicrobium sediminis TaxID=1478221 RepID=A0A267MQJ4_9FIRM|nr:hypothetical protein CCE28_01080 [Anaeromicrobium sediminis]